MTPEDLTALADYTRELTSTKAPPWRFTLGIPSPGGSAPRLLVGLDPMYAMSQAIHDPVLFEIPAGTSLDDAKALIRARREGTS
jgi:hypothetical protein